MESVIHFDAGVFWHYLFPFTALAEPAIREGLIATIYIAVVAQLLGMTAGTMLALGRRSNSSVLRGFCLSYVTYIRGTPLVVQLFLIYYGFAAIGITKFGNTDFLGWTIPGVAIAGVLAFGINKAAYVAEIMRSAIASVDAGQWEAAEALGMCRRTVLRRVIFPQAFRIAIPGLGNEFNAVLKDTSLLVLIGGVELFHAYQDLNGELFLPVELYLAMSMYFLALTATWGLAQGVIERHLSRGFAVAAVPAPARKLRLGETLWRIS